MQHRRSRHITRLLAAALSAGALTLTAPAGPATAHPGHDHGSDSGSDSNSGGGSGGSAKAGGGKTSSSGNSGNGSKSVCADGTTRSASTPCDSAAR
ncbi:hypothetical protein MANY_05820 [Mycolicibacterium anyangense]|uniref:Uncharacterized protein n=1 Tax=Mycolicibacterium anyangense TaxID=1431246 RepID=A0A6N4W3H7_9MYCO|nr:hypothetical protein MANY_05820 [Mycolicibacterium anyangense]